MLADHVARLVRRALEGHPDAFAELVASHQSMVVVLARQHTPNWNEAEDIAQEAFLRAYRDLGRLRNPARFSTWLYGITLNAARERVRAQPPTVPIQHVAEGAQGVAPVSSPEPTNAEVNDLLKQVAQLPERLRLPLTLHYVDGLKYAEIGEVLGIREIAARSRVHRAKAILQKKLGPARP